MRTCSIFPVLVLLLCDILASKANAVSYFVPLDRDALLKEYIYVDQKRLDIYFDQVFSQRFVYEKVPFWRVGLSIIGPTAEGQQQRIQREFTPREKISKVLE